MDFLYKKCHQVDNGNGKKLSVYTGVENSQNLNISHSKDVVDIGDRIIITHVLLISNLKYLVNC